MGCGWGVAAATVGVPVWSWPALAVLTSFSVFLAVDRSRSLGHRAGGGWLVARAGSLQRRRDCVAAAGIVGWTVRQTLLQRRAGVATLVAATAAGVKPYEVVDVPPDRAWSTAASPSPWPGDTAWSRCPGLPSPPACPRCLAQHGCRPGRAPPRSLTCAQLGASPR